MSTKTSFELLAIAKLLRENDQELFLELHRDLFTGQYAQLYKLIEKSFSQNHKLPSIATVEATIVAKAPAELRPALLGTLSAIASTDLDGADAQTIARGLRDKQLLSAVDQKIVDLNNKALHRDVEGVREVLNEIIEKVNLDSVKPVDFMDAMDMPDNAKILPSGIDQLDQHIGGVAGLTIVSGSSGGGKSIALLQMAVGQFQQGKNILYISLELSAQVLGNRMKSCITGVPFSRIRDGSVTEAEATSINSAMADFKSRENKFRIITDPLDADELLNVIKVEKSLYDIDIVYVDYLNLVLPSRNAGPAWASLADTAKALHRLSHQLGVITVSASQVNVIKKPSGTKPPVVEPRGSMELQFSATLWMHLYSPDADEDGSAADAICLYVLKNRNGPSCAIMFEKDFAHMRINYVCEI